MFKEKVKVKVPTPKISRAVQEELLKTGHSWGGAGSRVSYAELPYLFVEGRFITHGSEKDHFRESSNKQVHYLQILVGDTEGEGELFSQDGNVYYYYSEKAWWFDEGELKDVSYDLSTTTTTTLLDVNENEIKETTMDKTNEMPELEAGRHVVKINWPYTRDGYYLVLENQDGDLYGKKVDEEENWTSSFNTQGEVVEVHNLPVAGNLIFKESSYNKTTLIWSKEDLQRKERLKQYQELRDQITSLEEQAEKLRSTL